MTRLATMASLSVAIALAALKLGAALLTGSVALLSLLIDSLADIGASSVTYFAVRVAQQPPDLAHRFGHGKAEALSALAQAAFVTASALFVLVQVAERFIKPQPITDGALGVVVISVSLVATTGLVLFQRHVVRRTGSAAIRADRLHYTSDIFANLAVLAALLVTGREGFGWVDPVVGGVIALVLLRGVVRIGGSAVAELMDRELPDHDRRRIETIVLAHQEVLGIHDLRSRQAAGTHFLEFHLELDGQMSLSAAHEVTEALEVELAAAFADAEIIIHQEPIGLEEARLDHRIVPSKR